MRGTAMLVLAVALACVACQPSPNANVAANNAGQAAPAPTSTQPDCREFIAPVTAAGHPEQASGQACRQTDGSWRVVQNTPGLPTQEYIVPRPDQAPPPANAAAPQSANAAPSPATQTASTEASPAPGPPPCTSYTVPLTVGGQPQQAVIESCPQLDGSWRITQTTPGLPPQVYDVPPPPPYAPYPHDYAYAYPDFFPYWWGAPWVFGIAPSIVVVQRFNHFHHGFGHGFMHGFMRGGFAARGGGMAGGHR
jgi:surface antigen